MNEHLFDGVNAAAGHSAVVDALIRSAASQLLYLLALLVVTIGGQVVRDAGQFRQIAEGLAIGQEVVVEVKRKNQLLSVKLTPVAEE